MWYIFFTLYKYEFIYTVVKKKKNKNSRWVIINLTPITSIRIKMSRYDISKIRYLLVISTR